jgi:3-hydroxyisobutyrate dehydrogenase-like beta-hydroxyacid dehydrogenase
MSTVAILNPGTMGVTIGAAAKAGGSTVLWASAGRGDATRSRAEAAGLEARDTLAAVLAESDVVLSVCPPHAALDLAQEVAGLGFSGLYMDGNAIAPATALEIGRRVEVAGARFVDGGIIGPPARHAGSTRLYLSGDGAREAAQLFQGSVLAAIVCGDRPGAASALKMCYAAWTKGSAAMLMAVRAAAEAEGVGGALTDEWALSMPGLEAESEDAAGHSAAKAWRFAGEMREIADTFAANGLPDGFHGAAAELYDRLASFKDAADPVSLDAVIAVLNDKD